MSRAVGEQARDGGRPIRVGIGLIGRAGRYLIRRRPPGSVYAGYWEFPGGKCEPGESPDAAARRECREEIGIDVRVGSVRRVVEYRYPHGRVEMSFFDCTTEDPRAEPARGTGFRWVAAEELTALCFPEANGPILEELARESVRSRRPEPERVDKSAAAAAERRGAP
ncbi:MAG TPA: (deoxy)nucleoside triphosphate pyrophosphohydrolase [Isosphaeraceae bacterium]|nr:(deoxy)nucleoside triphosphate pyrophosphohydrolase [Isosphaeraceae bacterium]